MAKICVIILNYNGTEDTLECIESVLKHQNSNNIKYYILDNGSTLEAKNQLVMGLKKLLNRNLLITTFKEFDNQIHNSPQQFQLILSDENYGFARGNNMCLKIAMKESFEYFLLMNNDTVLFESSISILEQEMDRFPQYGAMSVVINYFDIPEQVWNAGGTIRFGTREYYKNSAVNLWRRDGCEPRRVTFLTGCFLMLRRKTLEDVGLLTDKFFFGEEDYEYCLRLKQKNIPIAVSIKTSILHKVGRSILTTDRKKVLAKAFVHHLNRYIDMRNYLGKKKWQYWCIVSQIFIFLKMLPKSGNIIIAIKYIKNLNIALKHYNCVPKKMFDYILQNDVTSVEFRKHILQGK